MSTYVRIAARCILLLSLLFTAGCGGSSFVGQRFNNFTAYYNTFYNAEKAYDEGVRALEQINEPVDRRFYLSIFPTPERATNNQTFQDAIDKSADVLRDHPDSKWVDDALLLIGKAYFYQQNFVGAEQKFREVIDIASPLEDEARLWLARTLITAGSYAGARDHLILSLNREDLSSRWAPPLHLALGELYVKQESFEEAVEELEIGLDEVRDNELEARGWFLLGQVHETLGRFEDAAEAYERVRRAHPRYELSYAADFSAVRVRGLHLDADEALRELRRMARDDKNYSNRFELAYLRGRIHQAGGRADEARDTYHSVLYDPEAQLGDLRGRIHYALGELYRSDARDFLTASAHFDTARTALPATTVASGQAPVQYAPEAIVDAQRRAEIFTSFAGVRLEIARMDSLLELGSLDPEEFAGRIMEIREQKAREMAEQQRRAERLQAERGFQDAASRTSARQNASVRNEATGEAGFLFHRDPIRVQEARLNFFTRWGERPHVPNWRRSDAVAAAASNEDSSTDGVGGGVRDIDPSVSQSPLPPLDYSDVPRDSVTRAAMVAARALARYELGNVLFLSMNRPDSAAAWYRMVIDEDREEEVAQRAFYALAEVHRSIGDSAAARELYEQVVLDFPESDFAGRVREQLGIREDVSHDSLTLAFDEYDEVVERWRRGSYADALDRMVTLAARHRQTEVAPKALLAAGRIYMEWADRDSLDVFDPLPLSIADSVLEKAGLLGLEPAPEDETPDRPVGTETGRRVTTDELLEHQARDSGETPPAAPRTDVEPRRRVAEDGASGQDGREVPDGEAAGGDSGVDAGAAAERPPFADSLLADVRVRSAETPSTTQEPPGGSASPAGNDAGAAGAAGEAAGAGDAGVADAAGEAAGAGDAELLGAGTEGRTSDAPLAGDPDALLRTAPDTTASRADSLPTVDDPAGADSLAADDVTPAEGGVAAADTIGVDAVNDEAPVLLASAEADQIYLKTLYAGVRQHYPSTDYAAQAEFMLSVLDARSREIQAAADSMAAAIAGEVPADSTGLVADADTVGADSLLTDADSLDASAADSLSAGAPIASADSVGGEPARPGAASDSLGRSDSVSADSTRAAGQAAAGASVKSPSPTVPTGQQSLRGEGGIANELGGYTLVLGMDEKREPMAALAGKYGSRGFRTDVLELKIGNTVIYRAALGHFANAQEAGQAANMLRSSIEEGLEIAPLRDFE